MNTQLTSICIADTLSYKDENQDAVNSIKMDLFNALVLADGIGSTKHAKEASEAAVYCLTQNLQNVWNVVPFNLKKIFRKTFDDFCSRIETLHRIRIAGEKEFGTTLLCAVESDDAFRFAYTGNGAILHLKGEFISFRPQQYLLPWCYANLLVPHTLSENGQEALYKYYGYGAGPLQTDPTVLELSKDSNGSGDIIILCTDGILSNDQLAIGKDNSNKLWKEESTAIGMLLNALRKAIEENEELTETILRKVIKEYLKELKAHQLMTDDSSVGIIVSARAQDYFRGKAKNL